MDRHHAIRVVTRNLTGQARERAIDKLLKNPDEIGTAWGRVLHGRAPIVIRGAPGNRKRNIQVHVRLSAEEYLALRDEARRVGMNMAKFLRFKTLGVST